MQSISSSARFVAPRQVQVQSRQCAASRPVASAAPAQSGRAFLNKQVAKRGMRMISAAATEKDVGDNNILEICSLGPPKTLGEKEADFLLALQNFYSGDKQMMTNEEFDILKQELIWEGSKVAVLTSSEQKFLEAVMMYQMGKPMLSDAEFDELKLKLVEQGSPIAVQGARCSIRTRRQYSDATVDTTRLSLLYVPGVAVGSLLVYALDKALGLEMVAATDFPEPWNVVAVWSVAIPAVALLTNRITDLGIQNFTILKAPCPECGTENNAFFGDILSVKGEAEVLEVACSSCGKKSTYYRSKRQVILNPEK